MIIKQVTVRIEDRAGRAWQVFQTLADSGINILAYSVNDQPDCGILRLIVDDQARALRVLAEAGIEAVSTDVYSLAVPNETGSMSAVLRLLSESGISIDFLYCFQWNGISQAILHSADMARLEQVLKDYELQRLR